MWGRGAESRGVPRREREGRRNSRQVRFKSRTRDRVTGSEEEFAVQGRQRVTRHQIGRGERAAEAPTPPAHAGRPRRCVRGWGLTLCPRLCPTPGPRACHRGQCLHEAVEKRRPVCSCWWPGRPRTRRRSGTSASRPRPRGPVHSKPGPYRPSPAAPKPLPSPVPANPGGPQAPDPTRARPHCGLAGVGAGLCSSEGPAPGTPSPVAVGGGPCLLAPGRVWGSR